MRAMLRSLVVFGALAAPVAALAQDASSDPSSPVYQPPASQAPSVPVFGPSPDGICGIGNC